jgi:hypothetical protein
MAACHFLKANKHFQIRVGLIAQVTKRKHANLLLLAPNAWCAAIVARMVRLARACKYCLHLYLRSPSRSCGRFLQQAAA